MAQIGGPAVGGGPWCRAGNIGSVMDFTVSRDFMSGGLHEVSLKPNDVVVNVSRSWGGGTVTVPGKWIEARFVIELQKPLARRRLAKPKTKLNIVAMTTTVRSVTYPRGVCDVKMEAGRFGPRLPII